MIREKNVSRKDYCSKDLARWSTCKWNLHYIKKSVNLYMCTCKFLKFTPSSDHLTVTVLLGHLIIIADFSHTPSPPIISVFANTNYDCSVKPLFSPMKIMRTHIGGSSTPLHAAILFLLFANSLTERFYTKTGQGWEQFSIKNRNEACIEKSSTHDNPPCKW